MTEKVIPPQRKGDQSDNAIRVQCTSREEAVRLYEEAKKKLLDINNWNEFAGRMLADFTLCNAEGEPKRSGVSTDDYIRINIPGPGTVAGEGYDWVRVEKVSSEETEDKSLTFIRVRPASSPVNEKPDVAHFFSPEATSSFIVRREQQTVITEIHGRNEVPNTHTESAMDNLRNSMAARVAVAAFSDIQWQHLIKGWLG